MFESRVEDDIVEDYFWGFVVVVLMLKKRLKFKTNPTSHPTRKQADDTNTQMLSIECFSQIVFLLVSNSSEIFS